MHSNIFQLLRKTLNTIKYNGLFIFLAILFPLILFFFDAGKEIFLSMSEEDVQLNLSLCLIAAFVLGYAVWCIPTLAISIFQFMTGYYDDNNITGVTPADTTKRRIQSKERLFTLQAGFFNDDAPSESFNDTTLLSYNPTDKSQFPIRYFAIFPWVMFLLTYYFVVYKNTYYKIFAIMFLILCFLVGKQLFKRYHKKVSYPQKQLSFLLRCTIPFLAFLILPYLLSLSFLKNYALIIFPLIGSIGVVIFYYTLRLLEEGKINYKLSDFNYRSLLAVLILSIITFYVLNNNQLLSRVSVVVILFIFSAFLITVIDLFFTSQYLLIRLTKKKLDERNSGTTLFKIKLYELTVIAVPITIIIITLFVSINSHRIRKVYEPDKYISIKERPTFAGYFDSWYAKNHEAFNDSTIYLISGQGGGSRAAAWFFMNMANMEKDDPNFFKKVFSISTVSGSSVGAYMYLGVKYHDKQIDSIEQISKKLFGRNYLSSNFFGLLLGDGIDGIWDHLFSSRDGFPKDRNYYFQKEEMSAFDSTFQIKHEKYFEQDYMHIYLDTSKQFRYPLFFINTAIIEKGTRGLFSPVKLDTVSLARDLYQEFKHEDCNGGYNIPMTTCVGQSQAFPLMSAYNYMDNVGRFIDGGLYENTGCGTTLEIYQELRKYLNSKPEHDSAKHLRIALINITNGDVSDDHTSVYKPASILNSLTAIVNTPFGGHQNFAIHNLSRQVDYLNKWDATHVRRDTVLNIPLNESVTLTRCLSNNTISIMYQALPKTKENKR